MDLAKTLVNVRGGPGAMIAHGIKSQPGVVEGSSRARLLLDILACYELFGNYDFLLFSLMMIWFLTHAPALRVSSLHLKSKCEDRSKGSACVRNLGNLARSFDGFVDLRSS
jgi:hypothetical protein